jgi:hypothetical protein
VAEGTMKVAGAARYKTVHVMDLPVRAGSERRSATGLASGCDPSVLRLPMAMAPPSVVDQVD